MAVSQLDDEDLRAAVRGYLLALLPDGWLDAVRSGDQDRLRWLRQTIDLRAWWKSMAESGLVAPQWDPGRGGLGLAPDRARIVAAELRRVRAPRPSNPVGIGLVGPVLMRHGTDEQKALLARIASHEDIWCELFSEPDAGSDLASLATRAVSDGGGWVVNGQKLWSSLAHEARWGLMLARTNPDAEKHAGITAFIMDMTAPGVEVRTLRLLSGESHFNEVFFSDVRIPDSLRVGGVDHGWEVARTTLGFEHSGHDESQPAPGRDIDALIERYAPVGDDHLRVKLVDAWIEDQVGQALNAMLREKRPKKAVPGADGSLVKVFQSEHRQQLQELLMDLGGPDAVVHVPGDLWAERSQWAFLRSRTQTIAAGTSEIHRNKIAERLLGLPRDDDFRGVPWKDIPRS